MFCLDIGCSSNLPPGFQPPSLDKNYLERIVIEGCPSFSLLLYRAPAQLLDTTLSLGGYEVFGIDCAS